jgi:hypothetical protein
MTTTTRKAALDPTTRTVYGVGLTSDLARSDAGRYTAHPDRLHVTAITDAAYEYVILHGGAPSADLSVDRNGVCLRSEE